MLLNNDFPDEMLEGPRNAYMPQPESKEQLMTDLLNLKTKMNNAATLISESPFHGKTRHPGILNYFSANEWLQFADMHLRHHLRQKKRIDDFLERRLVPYVFNHGGAEARKVSQSLLNVYASPCLRASVVKIALRFRRQLHRCTLPHFEPEQWPENVYPSN